MRKLLFVDGDDFEKVSELLHGSGVEYTPVDIGIARSCIETTLFEIGVPQNTIGYSCLVFAVELELTEKGAITKVIYPEVAKRIKTNAANVERNIRFALDRTWEKGLNMAYFRYFQRPFVRPTNSVFISTVAQIVLERLEKESFGD